jgi:acyl-coenzyme A synthetase/AMP-(fatty) acid ligase
MQMPASDLRQLLRDANPTAEAGLFAPDREIGWREALALTALPEAAAFAGKSALISVSSQFDAARAMLALDGVAASMLVVPPDFKGERLASAMMQARVEGVVHDDCIEDLGPLVERYALSRSGADAPLRRASISTEWILPTSGTTGAPKLVAHRLESLTATLAARDRGAPAPVWSTFYDIRRFGGMQIFLRAVTSGASLVITDGDEPLSGHVDRMARLGVTHLSGTPSHWRRLLMSGEAARISPRYVRLSGEIADRAILDALAKAFPQAKIVHAYASTEAGVGFEVVDGLEGFPACYLDGLPGVELRIVDGTLRLRSRRRAERYMGAVGLKLVDDDGFVDTDDLVEPVNDRILFRGRRGGAINVGGLKVHPEEVEQVINSHEAVRMSRVKARRSPITGDIIVADVVLKAVPPEGEVVVRKEILASCRARLERHKAPVAVTFVATLPLSPGGKLLRGSE